MFSVSAGPAWLTYSEDLKSGALLLPDPRIGQIRDCSGRETLNMYRYATDGAVGAPPLHHELAAPGP